MTSSNLRAAFAVAALALCACPAAWGATAAPPLRPGLPLVATGAPSETAATGARLNGTLNPQGSPTTYAFQYGTSTEYAQQTPAQFAGSGSAVQAVTATLADLRPGTVYHARLVAASPEGFNVGADTTFKTAGTAPPAGNTPAVTTGAATLVTPHEALLTGTVNPLGALLRWYFEFGATPVFELRSFPQPLLAGAPVSAVSTPVSGLQSARIYHYRLVAVNEAGEVTAGKEQTFVTPLLHRLAPVALKVKVTPRSQRRLPDTVTVAGTLEPADLEVGLACKGFVSIVFRARTIAVQALHSELQPDCTFSQAVRFSVRRRLLGGRLQVHVLFPGNAYLTRIQAPVTTIQVG